MIKQALLKDKFALANFILLNESFVQISKDELYVIQVIEQYQNQYEKGLNLSDLQKYITYDIDKFKSSLNLLMSRNLINSAFKEHNGLNQLFYVTKPFWNYVIEKVMEYETINQNKSTLDDVVNYINSQFNRYLSSQEILRLETQINIFNRECWFEIVNQSVQTGSLYLDTILSLAKMHSDANCTNVVQIKSVFEEVIK